MDLCTENKFLGHVGLSLPATWDLLSVSSSFSSTPLVKRHCFFHMKSALPLSDLILDILSALEQL